MANKRMFSKDIVCNDKFQGMSKSAQALYMQLGMEADDDGFVDKVRGIVKLSDYSFSDVNELIENGYLISFSSGVSVITGWNINNTIPPSRKKATLYSEEMAMISSKDGIYRVKKGMEENLCEWTESLLKNVCNDAEKCLNRDADKCLHSIVEGSIDEDSIDDTHINELSSEIIDKYNIQKDDITNLSIRYERYIADKNNKPMSFEKYVIFDYDESNPIDMWSEEGEKNDK